MNNWLKVLLILLGISLMLLIRMCNKSMYDKELVPFKDSLYLDTLKIKSIVLNK